MSGISCFAQSKKDKNTLKTYKDIINVLANDSLNGRAASSMYEEKSAQFILNKLSNFNIRFQPQIQQFSYVRVDSSLTKNSKNLYCYIDNKANKTILIGAHYDHLGMGDGLSRNYGKKGIHNGADDNASGVALVLSLAKKFTNWENKKFNYLFVFYSAHELGLFGSAAFNTITVENFTPIALALNFDMVGRFDADQKIINIYGINTLLNNQLQLINTLSFDGIIRTNFSDKIYQCDLKKFAEAKIPSLSFTTGIHSDYHKITDDEDQINYIGMLQIENYIIQLLKNFTNL
jgi:Zn-dependent M28 family amino/carboxypeptidase